MTHDALAAPNPSSIQQLVWRNKGGHINDRLEKYAPWIEEHLGPRYDWAIIDVLQYDNNYLGTNNFPILLALCAKAHHENSVPFLRPQGQKQALYLKRAQSICDSVTNVQFHENAVQRLLVGRSYSRRGYQGNCWFPTYNDETIIRFSLRNPFIPAVLIDFGFISSMATSAVSESAVLVVRRQDMAAWDTFFQGYLRPQRENYCYLNTFLPEGSSRSETITPVRMQDLILSDQAVQLVLQDIAAFIKRKQWFMRNHLPYRRGYLLHGPPGNGKSSLIRGLLMKFHMDAYTLQLFNDKVDDTVLDAMYESAGKNRRSVVLYEDLDRAFPRTGERKTRVSMQHLLNCMDGATTPEGIITIATANEPTALDKAILQRPGRFDRVVYFGNPDASLRMRYFKLKAPYLPQEELTEIGTLTDGNSFAQLQETYILAGQLSYDRGDKKVLFSDVREASQLLRNANVVVGKSASRTGFDRD